MARTNPLRAGIALLAAAALSGCGSGSSDLDGQLPGGVAPLPDPSQFGAVAIVITDAPSQDWHRALATIHSITLLSEDGHVGLWEGEETIDFLDLESYGEVFVVAEQVPVGSYEKIRLQVSSLELQKLDEDGEVVESAAAKLVANGKIDLNPRGGFTVIGDETLVVQLDWDMKKSLKITEAGASGNIIVRPVVFVKIFGDDPFERFTRVHGTVRELGDDGFVLCQTRLASSTNDDLDELRHCIDVSLADEAGLFDPEADPAAIDAIQPGIELTAIGYLVRLHDGVAMMSMADRRIGDIGLEGHVVQIGPLGTFTRHPATATSTVGDNSRFGLDPQTGELTGGLIQMGTRIASRQAEFVGQDAIAPGVTGVFEGVPDADDAGLLKTSFIVLNLDEPVDVLSGLVQDIDIDAAELLVTVEEEGDRCVNAADAAVFLLSETDESLVSTQAELADLEPGMFVEAFGADDVDGCFAASVIYAVEIGDEEEEEED